MQNTRLSRIFLRFNDYARLWLSNPWRRLSWIIISLLLGFFLGESIAAIAGQAARWDTTGAALIVVFTEIVSLVAYHRRASLAQTPVLEFFNGLKVGITYSLFLEAFKLGS